MNKKIRKSSLNPDPAASLIQTSEPCRMAAPRLIALDNNRKLKLVTKLKVQIWKGKNWIAIEKSMHAILQSSNS